MVTKSTAKAWSGLLLVCRDIGSNNLRIQLILFWMQTKLAEVLKGPKDFYVKTKIPWLVLCLVSTDESCLHWYKFRSQLLQ